MCCVLWSVYCVLCAVRCAKLPHIPVSNTHSQQPTHPQRCGEKGGEGEGGERGGQRVRECVRARVGGGVRLCSSNNSHVEFLVMAVSWCVVVRSFQPRPATSTTPRPANPRLVRLGARISPAKTRARQGVPGGVVCPTRRNFCGRCRPCRGPPWLARPATLPTLPALRPAVPPRPPRPAAPTTPRPADLRLGQRACLLGLASIYFWVLWRRSWTAAT